MDLILDACDHYLLTPYVYPASWPADSLSRQTLSVYMILLIGGYFLYFSVATLSYYFVFDHRLMRHPQFLLGQVRMEITFACKSMPFLALLSLFPFLCEVRGYTKLYTGVSSASGWGFLAVSVVTFLMFTDCLIYWIHRGLHHRFFYKPLHKSHHQLKVPTPFASHAFNPLDSFAQGVPYHIYPFIFPLHKYVFIALFIFVNMWSVSIHDADYRVPDLLKPFINGTAHHNDHHNFYYYNYGQFFTLWDRIGGSYRYPSAYEGKTLLDEVLENEKIKGS